MDRDHVPHGIGLDTRVISAGVIPATVVSRHKLATLAGMTLSIQPTRQTSTSHRSLTSRDHPVTQAPLRLNLHLEFQAQRWPATANPHVFINHVTANRMTQVAYSWVNDRLGILAHRLREDRILDEIQATAGDLRRVGDLLGLRIHSTLRYAKAPSHPDLATEIPSDPNSD